MVTGTNGPSLLRWAFEPVAERLNRSGSHKNPYIMAPKQSLPRVLKVLPIVCLLIAIGSVCYLVVSELPALIRSLQGTRREAAWYVGLGPGNPPGPDNFFPVPAIEQQPPITDLTLLLAEDVTNEVVADELVLGVVVDGQARAYPINVMTGPTREVFNDELAGHAIAATW